MACRGRKRGFGTLRTSGDFPGAPGDGLLPARSGVFPARRNPYALPMSLSPQETEIRAISQSKHVLPPTKPSTFIYPWQTRPVTSRVSSPPAFRGEHPACVQPQFPALPVTASSPNHPAGRTAGSARTRSRVQTLENPFWGTAHVFPRLPSPKTPQAASPCSWACRRLLPPPPHPNRNAAPKPPTRGAWVRDPRAEGTGCRHRRPAYITWRSMHFKYLVSGAAGRMG